MSIHYDEKGKIFTEIIAKDPIPAIIQTPTHRIYGNVYVRQGDRLIDELVAANEFLAITDATVLNLDGEVAFKTKFMTINRSYIVWIFPESEQETPGNDGEGNP